MAAALLLAAAYRRRGSAILEQQTAEALTCLASLIEERDRYTHQHSLRVGFYAEQLARALGQPRGQAALVSLCARLHDLGKCVVSNDVLLKPGPLEADEQAEMIRHPVVGARMIEHFSHLRVGASLIRSHHEWYDGSGYPDGLSRSRIPLGARIIAVADAYDAMITDRPYRCALPHHEAVRRLRAGVGSQWDPRVIQKFLELIGDSTAMPVHSPSAQGRLEQDRASAQPTAVAR